MQRSLAFELTFFYPFPKAIHIFLKMKVIKEKMCFTFYSIFFFNLLSPHTQETSATNLIRGLIKHLILLECLTFYFKIGEFMNLELR